MSCKSCKNKNNIKSELEESSKFVSKGVIIFAIIWTALGIYGLVGLIKTFL
jgi:hypothetical protein